MSGGGKGGGRGGEKREELGVGRVDEEEGGVERMGGKGRG